MRNIRDRYANSDGIVKNALNMQFLLAQGYHGSMPQSLGGKMAGLRNKEAHSVCQLIESARWAFWHCTVFAVAQKLQWLRHYP